jgi:catechol 2,3-dioxygenase-like lactoylglutathione lyase family enzyme
MAFHHVAIATRDLDATNAFYTGPMGFSLDRIVAAPSPERGWARHAFYDTGNGQMIAFWDLHDDPTLAEFDPSISRGLGLPAWTNHLAFSADTLDDLHAQRERWLDHGVDVAEIDHGWCTSIYTMDPNDIMVEFCCTTAVTTDAPRPHPMVIRSVRRR